MTRVAFTVAGLVLCLSATCGPARADTASSALSVLCPGKQHLAEPVRIASTKHDVSPVHLVAVVKAESGCMSTICNARTGACGLGQILPGGSADRPGANLLDPATNLDLTARHLAKLLALCGTLGGALHVYHGHKRCGGWEKDKHTRRVLALVAKVYRELTRRMEKTT